MPLPNEQDLLMNKHIPAIREEIIIYYIPYVRKLASNYEYNRDDLFGEGMLGLVKALDTYDSTKCTGNFIGYAKHWILRYMYEFMGRSGFIGLPKRIAPAVNVLHQAIDNYKLVYHREPSDEELIKLLDRTKSKYRSVQSAKENVIRLDMEIETDSRRLTSIGDIISSNEDIQKNANTKFLVDILKKSLLILSKNERKIFWLRFMKDYTLEEVANELGVTRERIRQVEKNILLRLKRYHNDLLGNSYNSAGGVYEL